MARKSLVSAAAALAVLAVGTVAAAKDEAVVSLTEKSFAETIAKEALVLVKFTAPWCGHCKSTAAPFEEAAQALKGKAVLADVDATVETELATKYEVKGYPTIKLFANGEFLTEYSGARDKNGFVKFIERSLLPPVVELESAEKVDEFLKQHEGAISYVGVKLGDNLGAAFKKLSFSLRDVMPDKVFFGSVADAATAAGAKALSAAKPADNVVAVVKSGGEDVEIYDGKTEDLEKWIRFNAVPAFGEISRGNSQLYTTAELPVVLTFLDAKTPDAKVKDMFTKLATDKVSKGKALFAWVDKVALKSFQDYIGLTGKDPAVAIYSFQKDTKFIYNGDFTEDALSKWIKSVVAGDLKPTMKSEPVPEATEDPMKVVVGDSWKDVVEDASKDVLIMQYAPWCGHCQKAEPELEKAAARLATVESVVVAKMDATLNDAPVAYKAKGFPTIHFFPSGGKDAVQHSGGRSADDFVEFIKEHATIKFELSDADAAGDKDVEDDKKDEL
eukprot:TRINITY_DN1268_c0_g1_i1.p1 TRINITY_DN1268_c0_g1~~TRINITY_DN1268_c0_g1_i1.p1  ORF type:complete len:501 (+),score=198.74 TRINITY_DN1268_c0_g1_i1:213-1715(+)